MVPRGLHVYLTGLVWVEKIAQTKKNKLYKLACELLKVIGRRKKLTIGERLNT